MNIRKRQAKTVCACERFALEEDHFCSVDGQEELARDYESLKMSNPQKIKWVVRELYDYRAGALHDFGDQRLDFDTVDANGDQLLDRILGIAPSSSMKRLIARSKRRFVNVLDDEENLRLRHLLFFYAMETHRCRTIGRCSKNIPDQD